MLLAGVLLASAALRANPLNYYTASVPVSSQSTQARERAASLGLLEVLIRVSGSRDVNQNPAIRQALGRASGLMEQFHYAQQRDEHGQSQEALVMTFSPSVIEQLLRDAEQPFWPINRPNTLVWLVEDHPEEGKILINDPEAPMVRGLRSAAAERGLPLRWPLLDLEDRLQINAEQVWALEEEAVLAAARRYNVDTVLVGRYTRTSAGQWWATWEFFHRGTSRIYDLRADDVKEVGLGAVNPLADFLADRYSVGPGGADEPQLLVQVLSVESFRAYRGVLDYLAQLALVSNLQLQAVEGSEMVLTLEINGSIEQLNNALSLDRKILPEPSTQQPTAPWLAVPLGTPENPLKLRWVGGA